MTLLAVAFRAVFPVQMQKGLRIGSTVDFYSLFLPASYNTVLFAFQEVQEVFSLVAKSKVVVSFSIHE